MSETTSGDFCVSNHLFRQVDDFVQEHLLGGLVGGEGRKSMKVFVFHVCVLNPVGCNWAY